MHKKAKCVSYNASQPGLDFNNNKTHARRCYNLKFYLFMSVKLLKVNKNLQLFYGKERSILLHFTKASVPSEFLLKNKDTPGKNTLNHKVIS